MAVSGSAARRYAEALLSLAPDARAVSAFGESLVRLAPAFDRAAVASLRNPGVPVQARQGAIKAATEDEPVEVRSLLLLLLERDRIDLVRSVARTFADIVDARAGIAKARVTTAVPLDDDARDGLIRRLERASGKKIRATFAVDPTLLGGAKVQIGDHQIDSSLRARLGALGRQLAS